MLTETAAAATIEAATIAAIATATAATAATAATVATTTAAFQHQSFSIADAIGLVWFDQLCLVASSHSTNASTTTAAIR